MVEEDAGAVGRVVCETHGCTATFETSAGSIHIPAGWLVEWSQAPGSEGTQATGRLVVLCPLHSAGIRKREV
jgi:hypothetical protein